MDTLLFAIALLPLKFLSITTIKSFENLPLEARKYVARSAGLRLAVSWGTWGVAMLFVALGTTTDDEKKVIGFLASGIILLAALVIAIYFGFTAGANRRAKQAAQRDATAQDEYAFVGAPLTGRVLRLSALNTLVLFGILADLVVVALKYGQANIIGGP